jgi:hypothetical protein
MIKNIDVTDLTPDQIEQIKAMIQELKVKKNLETEINNQELSSKVNNFDDLLEQTKGIWTKGDGLTYQRKLRQEWS